MVSLSNHAPIEKSSFDVLRISGSHEANYFVQHRTT